MEEEERGWGGREGYLEEGTLGSALRAEEILEGPSCRQERGLGGVGTARVGKSQETRLEPQVSPEEPELNPWAMDNWEGG